VIEGDSARACFEAFRRDMSVLVSDVLASRPPLLVRHTGATRATMSFSGSQDTMRLESKFGDLELYLGQELEAYVRPGSTKKFTLRTRAYW
jgi:hypothetical protein